MGILILASLLAGSAIIGLVMFIRYKMVNHYKLAKQQFERGNPNQALLFLIWTLKFKNSNKYSYKEAQKMIASLELLKEIFYDYYINKDALINPVLSLFKLIPPEGGSVDKSKTNELHSFVKKMCRNESEKIALIEEEMNKGNFIEDSSDDKDFTDEIDNNDYLEILDMVTLFINEKQYELALEVIEEHTTDEDSLFQLCLFDLRAGIYMLQLKYEQALQILERVHSRYPDNLRTQLALGSTLLIAQRDIARAADLLKNVISMSVDRDRVYSAKNMLRLHNLI